MTLKKVLMIDRFGVGATVGPLLGGVFTDFVTWRWCFYFNLPVGVATVVSMLFFFHPPPQKHAMLNESFFVRLWQLDLIGNVILIVATVMLFLALSFAEQMAWGSAKIVGLLVGSILSFIIFCVWQWWKGDAALMPPRILGQRSVAASCAAAFFIYSAILIHSYYLPIWFQAVKGTSAVGSGVDMIPYVVANALFSLFAGIFVSKNGYFTAPAIVGCAIGTIGAGLISTIGPSTSSSMWIGYEILASMGIGMAIQQGFTAIQIVLPLEEVAIGTAAVVAFQSLGGAIFVSVGNTILQNSLKAAADRNEVPGVDIDAVIEAGAGSFRSIVSTEHLPALLMVYNGALRKVFTASVVMIGFGFIACLFLEWRNVNQNKPNIDEEVAREKEQKKAEEPNESNELHEIYASPPLRAMNSGTSLHATNANPLQHEMNVNVLLDDMRASQSLHDVSRTGTGLSGNPFNDQAHRMSGASFSSGNRMVSQQTSRHSRNVPSY